MASSGGARVRSAIVVILSSVHLVSSVHGQQAAPAGRVQRYNHAIVRVELLIEGGKQTPPTSDFEGKGSGLVVRVEGEDVTILTALQNVRAPGSRSRSGGDSDRRSSIWVVFDDGTDAQRKAAATLLDSDGTLGLAILKATSVKNPPRALNLSDAALSGPQVTGSKPALLYGIPADRSTIPFVEGADFGSLKGNALTASLAMSANALMFRFEGASDAGLVGGPLVEEDGALLGVSTAVESERRVGRYVPLAAIHRAFEPRFEDWSFALKAEDRPPLEATKDKDRPAALTKVAFACRLKDPLGDVRELRLRAVPRIEEPDVAKLYDGKSWRELTAPAKEVPLKVDGAQVAGVVELDANADPEETFWVQLYYPDSAGGFVNTEPVGYRLGIGVVPKPAATPAKSKVVAATRPARKFVGRDAPVRGNAPSTRPSPSVARRMNDVEPIRPSPSTGRAVNPVDVSPDDEPTGGFSQLKGRSQGGRAAEPRKSDQSLVKQVTRIDDLKVTELDVSGGELLPCTLWSSDKKSIILADKSGLVRRIRAHDFVEEVRLDTQSPCSWLSMSAQGLLLTVEGGRTVWLVDPVTLQPKDRITVPSVNRVVAAPTSSQAYAVGGSDHEMLLSVIDLKSKEIVRQFGTRDVGGVNSGFKNLTMTPNGKFLFTEGGEKLQRFRVRPDGLEFQESSARIAHNGRTIEISPDGFYVALPSGGGNATDKPYSTQIFKITDLSTPEITIQSGAYPQVIGFDMKAGLIFAQNHQFPLQVFLPTGLKQREYRLGSVGGNSVKQFLAHPAGRKLFLLTDHRLYFVELPAAD